MRERRRSGERGLTLVELLTVAGLLITLAATGLPLLLTGIDRYRTASAARYLAGRCRLARMEAVRRSAAVALRFQRDAEMVRYAAFLDGNSNGVRNSEIARGIDRPISAYERIGDLFPGVTFALRQGIPAIGATTAAPGDRDGVQIGRSNIMTFTPLGSATGGTLYLLGRGETQYAVRVLGATGRTRVFRFDTGSRTWIDR